MKPREEMLELLSGSCLQSQLNREILSLSTYYVYS